MTVNEVGALLIGSVVGWLLMYTLRRQSMDWKVFSEVVVLIAGGSGLAFLTEKNLMGYFWIGIFAGFVANIIVKAALKEKAAEITTMR